MRFIELTVLYHAAETDPRDGYDRVQKRLFNLDYVDLVMPDERDVSRAVVVTRGGGMFVVGEAYAYLAAALRSWQPLPA